ncbi:uncharacterized protein LOC129920912 [Episyrphus balteatus]|uniref:uncharacterized protein LOC129920912 n=1 Tax=Episyrphus balteatus TaxID=286459 RepID=UPI002485F7BE|nr:uncharacterized protein LOC129920912 [Episyrphus balteatus]
MDVCGVYVGDGSLAFGSMRNSYYRDYEQFPYGTLENQPSLILKDSYSKVKEKCQQTKVVKSSKKECPFCKDHKKRPLTKYLRTRVMRKHNESICEEEEEEVEEEEQQEEHNHGDQHRK